MTQPARKVTNRGGRKVIGTFPSLRTRQSVKTEGQLERDFLALTELWDDVVSIQHQPVKIEYLYNPHTGEVWLPPSPPTSAALVPAVCYPDFLITFDGGRRLLAAVTSHYRLVFDHIRRQNEACRLYARQKGWGFQVFTDRDIRTEDLDRARLFRRYRLLSVPDEIREEAVRVLAQTGPQPCCVVARALSLSYVEALAYVYALIADGSLTTVGRAIPHPYTIVDLPCQEG